MVKISFGDVKLILSKINGEKILEERERIEVNCSLNSIFVITIAKVEDFIKNKMLNLILDLINDECSLHRVPIYTLLAFLALKTKGDDNHVILSDMEVLWKTNSMNNLMNRESAVKFVNANIRTLTKENLDNIFRKLSVKNYEKIDTVMISGHYRKRCNIVHDYENNNQLLTKNDVIMAIDELERVCDEILSLEIDLIESREIKTSPLIPPN